MRTTPSLLEDKHTAPCSVNIQGVDQMVLICVEVPEGVKIAVGGAGLPMRMTVVLKKHLHSLEAITAAGDKTMVFCVAEEDINHGWLKYKCMFATPTRSDKQTERGHPCGLSCTGLVQGKHFCIPIIM